MIATAATEAPPLKLSEAGRQIGLSATLLRKLIDHDVLVGQRGAAGHWHMRADNLPTIDDIVDLLFEKLAAELRLLQERMANVVKECEALTFDAQEALDHLEGRQVPDRLGDDLRSGGIERYHIRGFGMFDQPTQTTYLESVRSVAMTQLHIQLIHRLLKEVSQYLPPPLRT